MSAVAETRYENAIAQNEGNNGRRAERALTMNRHGNTEDETPMGDENASGEQHHHLNLQ